MTKALNISMGERVKAVRQSRKMTQKEFARELGMTAVWQSSVEVGRHQLSADSMKDIRTKFGVSYAYLIEGSGDMYEKDLQSKIDELKKERDLLLGIIQQLTAPR